MKKLIKTINQPNIFDVADYFLTFNPRITHMKLHKLIYYAYAYHLVKYKKSLLSTTIEAWKFGPVFPSLYPLFQQYTFEVFTRKTKKGKLLNIKGTYQKAIDYIITHYGHLDGSQLSSRTHFEKPLEDAYDMGRNTIITDAAISKYYVRNNKL